MCGIGRSSHACVQMRELSGAKCKTKDADCEYKEERETIKLRDRIKKIKRERNKERDKREGLFDELPSDLKLESRPRRILEQGHNHHPVVLVSCTQNCQSYIFPSGTGYGPEERDRC